MQKSVNWKKLYPGVNKHPRSLGRTIHNKRGAAFLIREFPNNGGGTYT